MLQGSSDAVYEGRPLYRGFDIIAVDPGVNFGMTIIDSKGLRVYNGKLKRQDFMMEYGWYAMNFIKDILYRHEENSVFVLEGAAYNKTFGQVGLADVRTGFYLGARSILSSQSIRIVAPMTARKVVWGDGRHQASEEFPTINHNAADSIGLALYGLAPQMRADVPPDGGA